MDIILFYQTVNGFCVLCRKDLYYELLSTREFEFVNSTIQFYRWQTFTDPAGHGIYKEVDNITQR